MKIADKIYYVCWNLWLSNFIPINLSSAANFKLPYYISRFTSLCKIITYLSFSRSFLVPYAPFSMLGSPEELAAMKFAFLLMAVGITEMLVWLACVIVSKSVWVLKLNWSFSISTIPTTMNRKMNFIAVNSTRGQNKLTQPWY